MSADTPAFTFPAAGKGAALEEDTILSPRFDANGLVTCVAVDAETGECFAYCQQPCAPEQLWVALAVALREERLASD